MGIYLSVMIRYIKPHVLSNEFIQFVNISFTIRLQFAGVKLIRYLSFSNPIVSLLVTHTKILV